MLPPYRRSTSKRFGIGLLACVSAVASVLYLYISYFMYMPDVRAKAIVVYSQYDSPYSYDACNHGKPFYFGIGSCKQGTFTEFKSAIAALAYARDHGAAGVKLKFEPDWWQQYFEQPYTGSAEEVHLNQYHAWVGRYRTFGVYYFDDVFPCPTNKPDLQDARQLVQQHIKMKPQTQRQLDNYVAGHFHGRHVIGVHYRGTDKIIEGGQRPVQAYLQTALSLAHANSWVYVATDVEGVVDAFERAFPSRVLSVNMRRAAPTATMSIGRSGLGLMHDSVMDMLRLSKCNILVKGRSSLSEISMLMSMTLPTVLV